MSIEDVGERHQPRRHRNRLAGKTVRIAGSVEVLVMAQRDLLGECEEFDRRIGIALGLLDRLRTEPRMRLHDVELFGGQASRLAQDVVGNADFADVVQRRRFRDEIDRARRQEMRVARQRSKARRQLAHVLLRSAQVISRFIVANLGETSERMDAHVLHELVFAHALRDFVFERHVAVAHAVARLLELDVRAYARPHDRRAHRLRHVIDGAELEAAGLVFGAVHRGDEHDGYVVAVLRRAKAPQHLVAVHARHHDVEQDQIRVRNAARELERARARYRDLHAEFPVKNLPERGQILGRVIDDQYVREWHPQRHGQSVQEGRIPTPRAGDRPSISAIFYRCTDATAGAT